VTIQTFDLYSAWLTLSVCYSSDNCAYLSNRCTWLSTFNSSWTWFCQWQDMFHSVHRSSSVGWPRVWNNLPADLWLERQFSAFKQQLKAILF